MENNNISTSQGIRVYEINNNDNHCDSKSNTINPLQDENFIPFHNVDPDAFIIALKDDIVCHVIDDYDSQE